jgi:hypothetical protein
MDTLMIRRSAALLVTCPVRSIVHNDFAFLLYGHLRYSLLILGLLLWVRQRGGLGGLFG